MNELVALWAWIWSDETYRMLLRTAKPVTCSHCGNALTDAERTQNEQTRQAHGMEFDLCQLCWDAWGEMTYGWQAGVPEEKRVRFIDRDKKWKARARDAD